MHAKKISHAIVMAKVHAEVEDAIACQDMKVKAVKLKQSVHKIVPDTVFAVVKLAIVTQVLLAKHVHRMQKKQERRHVYQQVAQQTVMVTVYAVMALVIITEIHLDNAFANLVGMEIPVSFKRHAQVKAVVVKDTDNVLAANASAAQVGWGNHA